MKIKNKKILFLKEILPLVKFLVKLKNYGPKHKLMLKNKKLLINYYKKFNQLQENQYKKDKEVELFKLVSSMELKLNKIKLSNMC